MYNEEEIVWEFTKRVLNLFDILNKKVNMTREDFEVIFVNDGSKDNTLKNLKSICDNEYNFSVINLSRNHGHQLAITAGIDVAKGDAIAVIDGDLQDPPEFIADMYMKFLDGFDVIYAVRKKRDGESLFKLLTAKMFYRTLKKLTNVSIPVDTGDFRIISRRVANLLGDMKERDRFIRGMVSWVGFGQIGLEYDRQERFAGSTKYPLSKMLKLAFDGITSFSSIPLKLASYMGFATAFLGFLYSLYVIYLKLFTNDTITGWSSIMIVVLILGGIQLITIGIIGEYIARINDQSKNRPLYIIDEIYHK
jgi:dolichol-phosphate mannosyltransferase